jgi:hypothetical protein
MNTIEQLVEALKYHTAQTRPIQQTIEAIAAGEQELKREPDHYRAILSASLREQIHTRLHVIVFRDRKSGEDFVESEKTFGGWDYTLEPLYTREETK